LNDVGGFARTCTNFSEAVLPEPAKFSVSLKSTKYHKNNSKSAEIPKINIVSRKNSKTLKMHRNRTKLSENVASPPNSLKQSSAYGKVQVPLESSENCQTCRMNDNMWNARGAHEPAKGIMPAEGSHLTNYISIARIIEVSARSET
jgi:hypothetical protein